MSDGGIGTVVKKTVNKLDISFHKSKQLHFSTHGFHQVHVSILSGVNTSKSHDYTAGRRPEAAVSVGLKAAGQSRNQLISSYPNGDVCGAANILFSSLRFHQTDGIMKMSEISSLIYFKYE